MKVAPFQSEAALDLLCPKCGAAQSVGLPCNGCQFCGENLGPARRSLAEHQSLKGLIWIAKGYRVWSLGVFALAVMRLLLIGDARSLFSGFLVLVPFAMALGISFSKRIATPVWLVAFLVLVDVGVILAPAHGVFPWLDSFPDLPRTENRILSWYFLVYGTLQFGLAPPIALGRSLHTAWRGGRPALAPWICVFGLGVWGLLVFIVAMGVLKGFA